MLLDLPVSTFRKGFKPQPALTDVPPGISCFMNLHPRGDDVGGVTEERKPHVFNVEIVERLPYCSVEFVTLVNEVSAMQITTPGELAVVYATIG